SEAAARGLSRRGVGVGKHPLRVCEVHAAEGEVLDELLFFGSAAKLDELRLDRCDSFKWIELLARARKVINRRCITVEIKLARVIEETGIAFQPVAIGRLDLPLTLSAEAGEMRGGVDALERQARLDPTRRHDALGAIRKRPRRDVIAVEAEAALADLPVAGCIG